MDFVRVFSGKKRRKEKEIFFRVYFVLFWD